MIKKARWKKLVVAGANLMSLGMVFPAADIQAEEVDFGPGIVEIVNDDSISTCADQIRIVYRIHNGRRQKRRWNQTQGEWVDKKWIDLGPAQNLKVTT